MKLQVQTLLNNRYRITAFLSQGGFGYTYLADDDLFGKKVCIKELFISDRSTRGPKQEVITEDSADFSFDYYSTRFWEEARQLAAFDHPNIVKVKDFFRSNGSTYLVMEYIEGETLQAKKLKGGLNDEQRIFAVMSQLLDAVETVHKASMLHRDIKPENVLIDKDNKVLLIDFGSARDFEDGKTISHTTLITPGYAPIEQYSNRAKRGAFTDIYALGATLYFLLTGQKPLPATDRYREQLPSPQQLNSAISTQLSSAVMMAIAMEPEDRFQSVADLKAALLLSGKASEKTVQIKILPPIEMPTSEKTVLETTKKEEDKPVGKYKVLIFGIISLVVLLLLAFVFLPQGKKRQNYCECYNTLSDRVKNEKSDSLKIVVYEIDKSLCDTLGFGDCQVQIDLEKTIATIKVAEANRLENKKEVNYGEEKVKDDLANKPETDKKKKEEEVKKKGEDEKKKKEDEAKKKAEDEVSKKKIEDERNKKLNATSMKSNRCNQIITHEVVSLETFSSIVDIYKKECDGLSAQELINANKGQYIIRPGQRITFTCKCK
jgi:serine/threonine protein kinase